MRITTLSFSALFLIAATSVVVAETGKFDFVHDRAMTHSDGFVVQGSATDARANIHDRTSFNPTFASEGGAALGATESSSRETIQTSEEKEDEDGNETDVSSGSPESSRATEATESTEQSEKFRETTEGSEPIEQSERSGEAVEVNESGEQQETLGTSGNSEGSEDTSRHRNISKQTPL